MNSLQMILLRKMQEADQTLDIQGSDRKILQIANQDLTNYLMFTWKFDYEEAKYSDFQQKIIQRVEKDPKEFESFIAVWANIWLRKWKQRVKLLLGEQIKLTQKADQKQANEIEYRWNKLENKHEMLQMIIATLIKNAEICGTDILATNILKTETGKAKTPEINEPEQQLSILNQSLRNAKEMTQRIGPLISVKVDKGYYIQ